MTPSSDAIAWAVLALAAIPAALTAWNLLLYRRTRPIDPRDDRRPRVSILIPARDEETTIGRALDAALASRGIELEVVVLDDASTDRTAEIVGEVAARDPRVRLLAGAPLPAGWAGKQHACEQLGRAARHELLLFVDADVTLAPDAARRLADALARRRADYLSGVPLQETGTLAEKLVVPQIHSVLLGYLPLALMRRRPADPGLAAGCGQLVMVRKSAWHAVGGHAAIRATRHDGLALPRLLRRRGARTDLVDVTDLASCRMYRDPRAVWHGFAKNADEGMASPAAILPWTLLLGGGQVAPFVLAAAGLASAGAVAPPVAAAVLLTLGTRTLLAWRFRQDPLGALLHPVGVALLLAIQWYALAGSLAGRRVAWKGRTA